MTLLQLLIKSNEVFRTCAQSNDVGLFSAFIEDYPDKPPTLQEMKTWVESYGYELNNNQIKGLAEGVESFYNYLCYLDRMIGVGVLIEQIVKEDNPIPVVVDNIGSPVAYRKESDVSS